MPRIQQVYLTASSSLCKDDAGQASGLSSNSNGLQVNPKTFAAWIPALYTRNVKCSNSFGNDYFGPMSKITVANGHYQSATPLLNGWSVGKQIATTHILVQPFPIVPPRGGMCSDYSFRRPVFTPSILATLLESWAPSSENVAQLREGSARNFALLISIVNAVLC